MRIVVGLVLVLSLGCTKENPHACGDGTCNDPQLPFCDTRGTLGGTVNECVAVTCTPGAFAECRGDTSVVCDATGENYELQECVRGCDDATGGCHIDPSNDLGQYYDMVLDPPDLEIVNGTIDTTTGLINGENTVPNFLVAAPPGGVAVRVFVVRRAKIGTVTVEGSDIFSTPPALAILATEEITVENVVTFATIPSEAPGSVAFEECKGKRGVCGVSGTKSICSGGGGGGNATMGAAGGTVTPGSPSTDVLGGGGGAVAASESLVPLRGGCASFGSSEIRGQGGGAIQLTSRTKVRVLGEIDVRGEPGGKSSYPSGNAMLWDISGGGAGGGILLEAPLVELGPGAHLDAKGGAGASRENDGNEDNSPSPSIGALCSLEACGTGGHGAAGTSEAAAGMALTFDGLATTTTGGGGGGGLGRARINSADGTYLKSATTIQSAAVTTGLIGRR